MSEKRVSRRDFITYGFVGAGVLLLPKVSHGGLFGKYGKLRRSKEVKELFEAHKVDPKVNYYVAGSEQWPAAIVGIDKEYTLAKSDIWKKVDINAEKLKTMVERMKHLGSFVLSSKTEKVLFHGCYILDDKDNRVGIWYATNDMNTVKMEGDKEIKLYAPKGSGCQGC